MSRTLQMTLATALLAMFGSGRRMSSSYRTPTPRHVEDELKKRAEERRQARNAKRLKIAQRSK